MRTIRVRNVHEALPEALYLLRSEGVRRESRNGPVLVIPGPVTTVYTHPQERVLFWPERDANPFLHLYESLWMLAGRNDIAPLLRYTDQFKEYSDDGVKLHGAYGHRWRKAFGYDQLELIATRLRDNPDDRRQVLQMWDIHADLGSWSKDVPCNLMVTFQRDISGLLDMCVFNRSNDIIWGAYGANAVHFSFLQEYMALKIGCPVGTYTQVSVNWHAYLNVLEKMPGLPHNQGIYGRLISPYESGEVHATHMLEDADESINVLANFIPEVLSHFKFPTMWSQVAYAMLLAHYTWKTRAAPERYNEAIAILSNPALPQQSDWIVAGKEWIQRRAEKWAIKMAREGETLGEA